MNNLVDEIYPFVKQLGNTEIEILLLNLARNMDSVFDERDKLLEELEDLKFRNSNQYETIQGYQEDVANHEANVSNLINTIESCQFDLKREAEKNMKLEETIAELTMQLVELRRETETKERLRNRESMVNEWIV